MNKRIRKKREKQYHKKVEAYLKELAVGTPLEGVAIKSFSYNPKDLTLFGWRDGKHPLDKP